MKLRFTLLGLLSLIAVSCSYEETFVPEDNDDNSAAEFYATIDEQPNADTKVYADENLKVLWNADDRITIFNKNTYNQQYRFTGENGDNAGGFRIVKSDDEFITSNPLDNIYAVYPYRETNKISNSGVVTTSIPSEQTYKANSFGIGSNTMVSVAESNMLKFKNVGGYLSLKFYGEGVSVSSITLKSNNGELIAGDCTVNMSSGTPVPSLVSANATDGITLTCEPPVKLGATASEATQFIFVLSPVTLSGGFTVTIATPDGGVFEKSSTNKRIIDRSSITRIGGIEVIPRLVGNIVFADDNFKAYCVENFDTDNDGEVSYEEALSVDAISIITDDVESIDEIVYFKNISYLSATGRYGRYSTGGGGGYGYHSGSFDVLPDCESFTSIASGKLSKVVLTGLSNLFYLDVSCNNISQIDIEDCQRLGYLACSFCNLNSLDLRSNKLLTYLRCDFNRLTSLDVSLLTTLNDFNCGANRISSLDLKNNSKLRKLNCFENLIASLDVSNNSLLDELICESDQLATLDVRSNLLLRKLNCNYNHQLTDLDVSNNTQLQSLSCSLNQLVSLDVSNNVQLVDLVCDRNMLTELDLSSNTALQKLYCNSNQLSVLDLSNNTDLKVLWCFSNQLSTLDISNNTALQTLSCGSNQLSTLNVSNNIALQSLYCDSNQLSSLDVSNNTALQSLHCNSNQLSSLNVSNNIALQSLYCGPNQLSSLDVSNNTALQSLYCSSNQLRSLDISYNESLESLYCSDNQLRSLDVSYNALLKSLQCRNNPSLTSIWLKNGQTIEHFSYDSSIASVYYKD